MTIHKCSKTSLYIEMYYNEEKLSSGTGFISKLNDDIYLFSNRHNFTGRDQYNNKPLSKKCAIPNKIKVFFRSMNEAHWIPQIYNLTYNDNPLWFEHPTYKEKADFAALKLASKTSFKDKDIQLVCFDPKQTLGLKFIPSENVSVIGFPFGKSAGSNEEQFYPIWINGFIASDLSINYNNLPIFLIDARTRRGQSGSPVFAIRDKTALVIDGISSYYNDVSEFLGIYSGRINEEADIGFVWKRTAIVELIESII